MIDKVIGITTIRMLYVQLLYRCNYWCDHCFHGQLLAASEQYTAGEVHALLSHFRKTYALDAVTLLGGEPFLHEDIEQICHDATDLGLAVEICTNGNFGFRRKVDLVSPYLRKLRVSLEGLEGTNDHIRNKGSFRSALNTIDYARGKNIDIGVTMTVTSLSLNEVLPLAKLLDQLGVRELKLHCLRLIGNAADHKELLVADNRSYAKLHEELEGTSLGIAIIYDSDLMPHPPSEACGEGHGSPEYLDRIEIDPRGALTMSCKAVGRHASAFSWNREREQIVYTPHDQDELAQQIPDVVYRTT